MTLVAELADDAPEREERLVGADRVVAVLAELAEHPLGVTLDELASILSSPKPTVHRALATLRRAGLADLAARGVYVLGDEFLRLAFRNLDGRADNIRIQPLLEQLATEYGETAHYATLAGTDIVYRAKMDPPQGAVRLTSVIGGRNPAYRTAVGKAMLGERLRTIDEVVAWFGSFPLEPRTPHTITTAPALLRELEISHARGYAVDDQENEVGVNCVAIPIMLDGSANAIGAISLSAVTFRCPLERLVHAVPDIRATIVAHLGPNSLGQPAKE